MSPDSKQELEFILKQLEYQLKCKKFNEEIGRENNSIYLLLYKILNHSEFNLAFLEDLLKIISLHGKAEEFFICFVKQINQNPQKNLIKFSNSNKAVLSQETLVSYPILNFLFIYNFFNSDLFRNFFEEFDYVKQLMYEKAKEKQSSSIINNININLKNHDNSSYYNNKFVIKNKINDLNDISLNSNINKYSNIFILFDVLKMNSICLLDAYSANLYNDPYINSIIPNFFKNLVIMLIKIESESDKFLSYFIFELIKKIKNSDFIELAIEVFIEKKDYIKLTNLVNSENCLDEASLSCYVIYAQIICILNEGNKWNSNNLLIKKCLIMNKKGDFHIYYYLKLMQFIMKNNVEYSLGMIILNQFALAFFELIKCKNFEKISFDNFSKINNKTYSNKNPTSCKNLINLQINTECDKTNSTFNLKNENLSSTNMSENSNISGMNNNTINKNKQDLENNNIYGYKQNINFSLNNKMKKETNFYIEEGENNIQIIEVFSEFFIWIEKINPDFIFSPLIFDLINHLGEYFEFAFFNETIENYFTINLYKIFEILNFLLNFQNHNKKNIKIAEEYPEYILTASCKLLNFMFLNSKKFFEEFYDAVDEKKKNEQFSLILDLLEIYKSLTLYYISHESSNIEVNPVEGLTEEFSSLFIIHDTNSNMNLEPSLNSLILPRISEENSFIKEDCSISSISLIPNHESNNKKNGLNETELDNLFNMNVKKEKSVFCVNDDSKLDKKINIKSYLLNNQTFSVNNYVETSGLKAHNSNEYFSSIGGQNLAFSHAQLLKKFSKYSEIFINTLDILEIKIEDYFNLINNNSNISINLENEESMNKCNSKSQIESNKLSNPENKQFSNLNSNSTNMINQEKVKLIDRINNIKKSTAYVEDVLKIEILSKDLQSKNNQKSIIINNIKNSNFKVTEYNNYVDRIKLIIYEMIQKYIENKRIIFLIISKVYHSGMKKFIIDLNKKILGLILSRPEISRLYSGEDVFGLYKDIINCSELKSEKVSVLKEFSTMVIKIIGIANENILNENLEWIFYQIYLVLTDYENENLKNLKNFEALPEVNDLKILMVELHKNITSLKVRSFVLNNIIEILFKKFLNLN